MAITLTAPGLINRLDVPADDPDSKQLLEVIGRLLERLGGRAKTALNVLQVRPWCGPHLAALSQRHTITTCTLWQDAVYESPEALKPGAELPPSEFDAVVLFDVPRYWPTADLPRLFSQSWERSRNGLILACPDSRSAVRQAEQVVREACGNTLWETIPTLAMGLDSELPDAQTLQKLLQLSAAEPIMLTNAPLGPWIAEQTRHGLRLNVAERFGWYRGPDRLGSGPSLSARIPDTYRRVYVCARDLAVRMALEASVASDLQHRSDSTSEQDAFAQSVAEALREFGTACKADQVRVRQVEQRTLIVESVAESLKRSVGCRMMAPVRSLKRFLAPRGFDESHVIPWIDLQQPQSDPQPGEPGVAWEAVGDDPQFVVPILLPVGWVRIEVHLSGSTGQFAEIYADEGYGAAPSSRLAMFNWSETLKADFYAYLTRPAQAIRLDPVSNAGVFRLIKFRVRPLPGPHALWRAFSEKVRLLREYRCFWRTLGKGLGMIAKGEFGNVWGKLFKALPDTRRMRFDHYDPEAAYDNWRKHHALTEDEKARQRSESTAWETRPLISVIMPTYNTPVECLTKAIESVKRQTYEHWQLCIADDGSTKPDVRAILEQAARDDARICVTFRESQGGISAASNDALALAKGDFLALFDHDDELAEHALFRVAESIRVNPESDMFYSDEDKIDEAGRHCHPFFKPDWSPEFFLTCMYTCHLGVYRASLVRQLGGFRSEFDFAQDYDLALRVVAASRKPIVHIPDVLYHWRIVAGSTASGHEAKPQAVLAARAAIGNYLTNVGRPGVVEEGPTAGYHRVRYAIQGQPKISIVIPSACRRVTIREQQTSFITNCVRSIRKRSSYANYEIIVVDNNDVPEDIAHELTELDVCRVSFVEPFNLSAKMNLGVKHASGEYVVLLNDDIEVITPDWLESMLEYAQWPEVGAVGCRLLFPDGRLQHVGVIFIDGKPFHHFYGWPGHEPGYWYGNFVIRNYSAVTGACLMTRADLYHEVGGFPEALPINFNDVDYCLKVRQTGRRIVYQPYAQLYHFESMSKPESEDAPREVKTFLARWPDFPKNDPYYSPHLTTQYLDYRIAGG